jgi:hypothetical protein
MEPVQTVQQTRVWQAGVVVAMSLAETMSAAANSPPANNGPAGLSEPASSRHRSAADLKDMPLSFFTDAAPNALSHVRRHVGLAAEEPAGARARRAAGDGLARRRRRDHVAHRDDVRGRELAAREQRTGRIVASCIVAPLIGH